MIDLMERELFHQFLFEGEKRGKSVSNSEKLIEYNHKAINPVLIPEGEQVEMQSRQHRIECLVNLKQEEWWIVTIYYRAEPARGPPDFG